ncbi:MAG TPA: hypothetical protein G4N92_03535 [Anaerolineae bacterium]|nr:hypothetical protein [Anaerolineae bacterium]
MPIAIKIWTKPITIRTTPGCRLPIIGSERRKLNTPKNLTVVADRTQAAVTALRFGLVD